MSQPSRADGARRISRIGLGLAALGRPGYITLGHARDLAGGREPRAMAFHTREVLDTAWAEGVRYFDAARSYGRAEEFLADWLAARGLQPGAATVASKWGYVYTAGWRVDAEVHEVKEHSLAMLRQQLAESRALLGAHLTLYQIHSATPESGVLENGAVIDELARLRDEGLRIGLSTSGPRQVETIAQAAAIERGGARVFGAVQATWNVLEPSAGAALADAHQAGMRVIVKEALANGRLTARNDEPSFARTLTRLRDQAERLGAGLDALALAAVLAQPWADIVLSGAATSEQLRSNLDVLRLTLDDEAHHALAALAESPERYWHVRSAMPWN